MRIVGLANPDLVDPSSAPRPPVKEAKYVDANSAEANGYSPKMALSYLSWSVRTMKKGGRRSARPSR